MRRLAGPWRGGGLERKGDRHQEGTGLGQPQLTWGNGVETGGELGKRPEGGRGQWCLGFGGEVGRAVPLALGRVGPEGLARSCPQVTRPLKERGGETGSVRKGGMEKRVLRGTSEGYCLRKAYLD